MHNTKTSSLRKSTKEMQPKKTLMLAIEIMSSPRISSKGSSLARIEPLHNNNFTSSALRSNKLEIPLSALRDSSIISND